MKIRGVKGMNDLLPTENPAWAWVEERFREVFGRYGYSEVRTPIVEETALFARSIGDSTDIVGKEMYTFGDRSGKKSLSLRPEGTAGAVRAYIEHSWSGREPVAKWWYMGPMYRYERVQAGRYRQFHQAGAEIFGVADPAIDAELLVMLDYLFREVFSLPGVELRLNSLGDAEARPAYLAALREVMSPHREALCADCQRRLETNPLRLLDCKVPTCQPLVEGAPTLDAYLGDEARAHFEAVKGLLDAAGVAYTLSPRLVRGLDYYNRTCFEFVSGDLGAQNAVCGGGRYDGLVKTLGGPDVPAIGFGLGLERLVSLVSEAAPSAPAPALVMISAGDDESFQRCFRLTDALRRAGVSVDLDLRRGSVRSQMKRADKSGATYALVIGERELEEGEAALKPLRGEGEGRPVRLELEALVAALGEGAA